MKLYVYCLAESVEEFTVPVNGISGAPVRQLALNDLVALVSDLEIASVPVTRENALMHEAVVRTVMNQTTPLPFRFGTLATAEQIQSYVSARKTALESRFALVRGCVEMSVKIIWNAPFNDLKVELPKSQNEEGPGAAFLLKKKREIVGSERLASEAAELKQWLSDQIQGLVREEQVSLRPTEKLVLAASHLVERDAVATYTQKLTVARLERPELHFLVSGPWAPYSFANIDLEFEMHFGVS